MIFSKIYSTLLLLIGKPISKQKVVYSWTEFGDVETVMDFLKKKKKVAGAATGLFSPAIK